MSRRDYDAIKERFGVFISTWRTKKIELLDEFISKEILCYMSIVKAYTDGSQHSLSGVKNFIKDFPKSDVLHTRICNYVCRIKEDEAVQSAHVVCQALKFEKGSHTAKKFECTAMFVNHWSKEEQGWMMDELRMDVCPHGGDLETFAEEWFFDEPLAKYHEGLHFPCIQGETDSPWNRIADSEDFLSEEEKIQESFAKYNFGVDNLMFNHVDDSLSEDLVASMPPWGLMDKRHFLECLKFHRQKDRYWAHPFWIKETIIDGDYAKLRLYRMAGHRQRNHPYISTKENRDVEHACGRYLLDFKKEDGVWRICKWQYYLGLIELGEYSDDLYGKDYHTEKYKESIT